MKLIPHTPTISPIKPESLDQLWHEAEQLGSVTVDKVFLGNGAYEVTISFARKTGTQIRAKGQDMLIAFALSKAINEAREMGA